MKHTTIFVGIGLALAVALPAAPAQAQNARSYLSGHGNDANNCRYTAPCRTFAGALSKTNSGGVISILDPAGYSAVTINKAISIINEGVGEAGITFVGAGIGIDINAGNNDSIILRGISIDGAGLGTTGIRFTGGKSLTIENCVIRHLTGDGIDLVSTANLGVASLSVSNTVSSDNGNSGIAFAPQGGTLYTATFDRVQTNNNVNYGIFVDGEFSTGTVQATVSDSIAANNSAAGFFAATASGKAPTTLTLFRSIATNNSLFGVGLKASGPGAVLRLSTSVVAGNAYGWRTANSGVIQSYGNNSIDGNLFDESAPPSVALK